MTEQAAAPAAIAVSVHSPAWPALCPDAASRAEAAARAALAAAVGSRGGGPLVVDVVLTDDAEQRRLNRTYRDTDAPTNVLAFALTEPGTARPAPAVAGAPVLLGDVVLACETVEREAREQGKPIAEHLAHLVVHGVLHLLGFDHRSAAEAAVMEAREIAVLRGLGVPDPYRDTM